MRECVQGAMSCNLVRCMGWEQGLLVANARASRVLVLMSAHTACDHTHHTLLLTCALYRPQLAEEVEADKKKGGWFNW